MPHRRIRHCLLALTVAVGACARSKPPRVAAMCDEGMVADSTGAPVRYRQFCRDSLGRAVTSPRGSQGDSTVRRGP